MKTDKSKVSLFDDIRGQVWDFDSVDVEVFKLDKNVASDLLSAAKAWEVARKMNSAAVGTSLSRFTNMVKTYLPDVAAVLKEYSKMQLLVESYQEFIKERSRVEREQKQAQESLTDGSTVDGIRTAVVEKDKSEK